jgi:hypothetical protein
MAGYICNPQPVIDINLDVRAYVEEVTNIVVM